MNNELLEISGLSVCNKSSGEEILKNLSFSIEKEKITGIVGESGSGKSVTALSIMGLLPPSLQITDGRIELHHKNGPLDICKLLPAKMQQIRGKDLAMIFQEPMTSLNPSMKCGVQASETLMFHYHKSADEARLKILELFHHTGLPEPERIFSSYPHQLSGGQRQRVMIAMALSAGPSLLIADEPTTALDVSVQKSIIKLLRNLQRELSLTVLFITHDLRLLGEIADRIVVMRSGEVVEVNSRSNIFIRPQATYTKGLLECQPPLDHKPGRLLTIQDFEGSSGKAPRLSEDKPISRQGKKVKEEILRIRELSITYKQGSGILAPRKRNFTVLHKLNLELLKGETLGLVGESGCGKTTLGKAILLLIEKKSGEIMYRGRNIAEMAPKERKVFRKNIQVVFQDPYASLNPRMKIGSVLAEARHTHFPEETHSLRWDKINSLMGQAGLSAASLDKYPHEFSGGQRQRIGILRALVTEPEIIVLDEAVSALDVSVQAQILNLLNDLKNEFELSYLFISHDLAVVNYMSDRILVMKEGKIEEEGRPYELFQKPASEYTRNLIEAIPSYQNSSGSS
ncbi:MAG: ABC transporter ATP-binding protein [Bacteroidales bacterium]|nr:ABC transporter ATP-binding protein [Bacteroidales bacterium]